jgi:hypothetical protein
MRLRWLHVTIAQPIAAKLPTFHWGRPFGGGIVSTDAEQGRMPPLKQINASCGALLGAVVRYPAYHIRADALKGVRRPVLNLSK